MLVAAESARAQSGLLAFITNASTSNAPARVAALRVLGALVSPAACVLTHRAGVVLAASGAHAARYTSRVCSECLRLMREGDNAINAASLQLLARALRNETVDGQPGEALPPGVLRECNLPSLYATLRTKMALKAPTQGVEAGLFAVAASLARFPAECGSPPVGPWLLEQALAGLRCMLDEAKGKSTATAVAGCIAALAAALRSAPPSPPQAATALRYVLQTLELVTSADATRYGAPVEALRLMAADGAMRALRGALLSARPFVDTTPLAAGLLRAVVACRLHDHAELRGAAKPALAVLFDELSAALSAPASAAAPLRHAAYDAAWEVARELLVEAQKKATEGGGGRAMAVSVRALGALAPAAVAVAEAPAAELARIEALLVSHTGASSPPTASLPR